jgi:WD40 repeat protein
VILRGHAGYVNLLAFSPDGKRLVSSSGDQTLRIWDAQRGTEVATLYGHHGMAGPVQFTKDGCTIYSAGFDGEIRFWESPPLPQLNLSSNSTLIKQAGQTLP